MTNYVTVVLRGLGMVLHVPGLMALVSLPICYVFAESYAIWPFVLTAVVAFGSGQLLFRLFRYSGETNLNHAMMIAALTWLFVSLIGALPFWLVAQRMVDMPETTATALAFRNPINAVFESFSGFTSTGLTVATDPSMLPASLQWWRSFTEWIGGAGVIVLILSVIGSTSSIFQLYYSEGRTDKLAPSMSSTVRTIWWIYLAYTIAATLLLRLVGIPWWEALNHAMAAISTGGFDISGNSITDYDLVARTAVLFIMLAGATSFAVHYQVLTRRNILLLWRDEQHRLLWLVSIGVALLVMWENWWFNGALYWDDSLFQVVSALTTTGFGTVSLQQWSVTTHLLIVFTMIIGGAAGSTVGGIKLIRLVYLYKGLQWRLKRISLRPHQVMRYEVNGKAVSADDAGSAVETAGVLAVIWILLIMVGTFVMLHVVPASYTLSDVIFEVASAQGNVGLSIGIVGPSLHWVGKLVLILHMYMGRLEILPVFFMLFVLLRPFGRETQRVQREHEVRVEDS